MSLTLKLASLLIRTIAKPVGNSIKRQAKEHEGFRRFAIARAQQVHRLDMRLRLGMLHDSAAQERMHERERKAEEDRKRKAETPTVRTEEEQRKHDEQKAKGDGEPKKEGEKRSRRVAIKPLSDARAIELGANFFSELFVFSVGVGLLLYENFRSRKKEQTRRDEVAERLQQLEAEVESLRAKLDPDLETLHDLSERIKASKAAKQSSWWNPVGWIGGRSTEDTAIMEESRDQGNVEKEEPVVPIHRMHSPTGTPTEGKTDDVQKTQEHSSQEKTTASQQHDTMASVTASTKGR